MVPSITDVWGYDIGIIVSRGIGTLTAPPSSSPSRGE